MTVGSSAGDAVAHTTAIEDKRRGPPTLPELLGAAQGIGTIFFFVNG